MIIFIVQIYLNLSNDCPSKGITQKKVSLQKFLDS